MIWIRWGSLILAGGIAAGAFGAHALRDALSPDQRAVYQTAVLYQLLHGLALVSVGILALLAPHEPWLRRAGAAFLVGVLLFSGSLYVVSLTPLKRAGAVTPIGGAAFLIGWICLAMAAR